MKSGELEGIKEKYSAWGVVTDEGLKALGSIELTQAIPNLLAHIAELEKRVPTVTKEMLDVSTQGEIDWRDKKIADLEREIGELKEKNKWQQEILDAALPKKIPTSYQLKAVYNLPDFNTLGYQSLLALEILKNEKINGSCLFWNPLQGHIPVIISKFFPSITEIFLGSRDLLQLKITKENLILNKIDPEKIKIFKD